MPVNSESNIALIYQPGNCLQEAILVFLSEFHSKKYAPFNRIFHGKKGRGFKRGDGKLSMPPIALNKSTFFLIEEVVTLQETKTLGRAFTPAFYTLEKSRSYSQRKESFLKNLPLTYTSFMKNLTCWCFKNMLFDVSVQALLWILRVKESRCCGEKNIGRVELCST